MRRVILAALLVATFVVGACGDGGGDLSVDGVWARSSANMQNAGAVYMQIVGGDEADRLIGVSVGADVAAMAEMHETSMADDGMMSMQPIAGIDIPAGGEVMLEPGGFHVMLMQLAEPLAAGAEFDVTLTFETAGTLEVTAEIREE